MYHIHTFPFHNFLVFFNIIILINFKEILSDFQVIIGTGCLKLDAFRLKYGGPLDCEQVQYIMGSCLGGGLLGTVVLVIWCKRRRRFKIRLPSHPVESPSVNPYEVKLEKS